MDMDTHGHGHVFFGIGANERASEHLLLERKTDGGWGKLVFGKYETRIVRFYDEGCAVSVEE